MLLTWYQRHILMNNSKTLAKKVTSSKTKNLEAKN